MLLPAQTRPGAVQAIRATPPQPRQSKRSKGYGRWRSPSQGCHQPGRRQAPHATVKLGADTAMVGEGSCVVGQMDGQRMK